MAPAITAIRMQMMESVDVMPIIVYIPAVEVVPIRGVVIPIPGRIPSAPIRTPEPVIYDRTGDVYRLYNIVGTVDVLVAHYLNIHLLILLLNQNACYILIDILGEDCLKNDEVSGSFGSLDYT